jgi:peptidoglycan/LPS O-acetylase OafA/YrhL
MSSSSARSQQGEKRLIQIDFVRGLAVLLVIGNHARQFKIGSGWLSPFADTWALIGGVGVDLFFVLSGFLVGGLLFRELLSTGRMHIGRFMIRRGFKIWPSYYAFLAFYLTYMIVVYRISPLQSIYLLTPWLVHLQNYLSMPAALSPDLQYWAFNARHTWSLAVEEHFYLALPIVLLLLSRFQTSRLRVFIPLIAGLLLSLCLALRIGYLLGAPGATLPIEATHMRIDGLFFGVMIAYVYHFHKPLFTRVAQWPWLMLGLGSALLVLPQVTDNIFLAGGPGYIALTLGAGMLLIGMMEGPARSRIIGRFSRGMVARAIAFVGFYSYSIYLWHLSAGVFLANLLIKRGLLASYAEARWLLAVAVYLGCAIGTGVVLGKLIEYPALALRDRLFPAYASTGIAEATHPIASRSPVSQ